MTETFYLVNCLGTWSIMQGHEIIGNDPTHTSPVLREAYNEFKIEDNGINSGMIRIFDAEDDTEVLIGFLYAISGHYLKVDEDYSYIYQGEDYPKGGRRNICATFNNKESLLKLINSLLRERDYDFYQKIRKDVHGKWIGGNYVYANPWGNFALNR